MDNSMKKLLLIAFLASSGLAQVVQPSTGSGGGTTTNPVTFATTGGAASGSTFNGSAPLTVSASTVGAALSTAVASGTANQVAYYAATGAAVSGSPDLTDTSGVLKFQNATATATTTVNIGTTTTASTSGSTVNIGNSTAATAGAPSGLNVVCASGQGTPCASFKNNNGQGFQQDGSGTTEMQTSQAGNYTTTGNCSTASCNNSAAGSFNIAAAASTMTIAASNITANSEVFLGFDASLGTRLGVTCNTTFQQPYVSGRVPGTSFAVSIVSPAATNPVCFSWHIIN